MSHCLCIVLLQLTCCAFSPQNEGHRIRNIVLVHGAWVDGSGWKGVYDILIKEGYNISIVQEPLTSFQEDVTAVAAIASPKGYFQLYPSQLLFVSLASAFANRSSTSRFRISISQLAYLFSVPISISYFG
jgi:hypothetical protein